MKKANKKRLSAIIALVSVLSTRPANALSNLAKGGIAIAVVTGVIGGGILAKYLLDDKKEKSDDEGDKKLPKINQKGQYYNDNVKEIKEQSKMGKDQVDKFISFVDSKDDSFLEQIVVYSLGNEHYRKISNGCVWDSGVWNGNVLLARFNGGDCSELSDDVIKQKKISEGVPWVNKFFDNLRGNAKIEKVEGVRYYSCFITIGGFKYEVEISPKGEYEDFSWIRICYYDSSNYMLGQVEYLTK